MKTQGHFILFLHWVFGPTGNTKLVHIVKKRLEAEVLNPGEAALYCVSVWEQKLAMWFSFQLYSCEIKKKVI